MPLYCGIDLHAKNSYLAIIDEQRKRIFKRNVTNDRKLKYFHLENLLKNVFYAVVEVVEQRPCTGKLKSGES